MADETRARQLIEEVLISDQLRSWTCKEMARRLKLTVRTIAHEVNVLREADRIERVYGKRRCLRFKAKPQVQYPSWMEPLKTVDLEVIIVTRVTRHYIDGDDE